jgi:hypothetical protein
MNVDYDALSELFRLQDIEGLIAIGVPEDEYEPVVELIYVSLEALPREQASAAKLVEIFNTVYQQRLGWSEENMRRRQADFEDIATKLMNYFG